MSDPLRRAFGFDVTKLDRLCPARPASSIAPRPRREPAGDYPLPATDPLTL